MTEPPTSKLQVELEQLLRDHQWDREGGEPCAPYKAAWVAVLSLSYGLVNPRVCNHAPDEACPDCNPINSHDGALKAYFAALPPSQRM